MESDINTRGLEARPAILAFSLENRDLREFVEAYKTTLQGYLATFPKVIADAINGGRSVEDVAITIMVHDFDSCSLEQTYVNEGGVIQVNHDRDKAEIIRAYLEKQGYITI
ncbi:MAG: hypothetical protein Q8Q01_02760 [archaeon]|nr:hypothetical protein [archaeon]